MTLLEAIVLGAVQGATEFLPISSTAHTRLVPALAGWDDPGAGFSAVIQLGTLVAVLAYFRTDIARTATSLIRPSGREADWHRSLAIAVIIGTIPISVSALLLKDLIEDSLRSVVVVAVALIGFALFLGLSELIGKRTRAMNTVRPIDGLIAGTLQAFALIPGASRSGVTISGGLLLGFDREAAARFSFLLSVPAILISGVYKLIEEREHLLADGAVSVFAATIVSFVVGYASIDFLLKFLRKNSTLAFILYRIVLGSAILYMVWQGILASN